MARAGLVECGGGQNGHNATHPAASGGASRGGGPSRRRRWRCPPAGPVAAGVAVADAGAGRGAGPGPAEPPAGGAGGSAYGAAGRLGAGWLVGGRLGRRQPAAGHRPRGRGRQPGSGRRRLPGRRPGARRVTPARCGSDVGRAVDAVYGALSASRDEPGTPMPGGLPPVPPPGVRLARVRTLTQWNDRAGRTQAEVLTVVDRAISATIMDLMSVPRPAPAGPAGGPQAPAPAEPGPTASRSPAHRAT